METMHFSIEGGFITDLVRTWFWEEQKPIQTCIDLIASCVSGASTEEIQQISTAILEGRKKFTGINIFTLEDDNKRVRPLLDKIKQEERERGILMIRQEMLADYRKYIDRWATIKTCDRLTLAQKGILTFADCRNWFTTFPSKILPGEREDILVTDQRNPNCKIPLFDTPTMGGLWLINDPGLVYNCCKGDVAQIGKPDFWKAVYEAVKDNPAFADRNERYLFSIRPKPSFEERMKALMKAPPEGKGEPEYGTPKWLDYKYQTTKDVEYRMIPDDLEYWEGLIAPNGDFYSCKFGGHNHKAYNLVIYYPNRFPKPPETLDASNALDFIREHGWCATRSVGGDHILMSEHPTRRQIETMLETAEKHQVASNIIKDLISYL